MSEQHVDKPTSGLRPLLSAGARRSTPTRSLTTPPPLKANPVVSACDECRRRKTKCSGERPACGRCVLRHVQCHYTAQQREAHSQAFKKSYSDLQSRAQAHEELFEMLKSLPNEASLEILQRIRSGTDVMSILNHVKAGDVLIQMAVEPESRFRYQLPYMAEMPIEFSYDNTYLDSIIFEVTSLYATNLQKSGSSNKPAHLTRNLQSHGYQIPYLKPFHAAEVIEPQLSFAKVSFWTTVSDDDALMRDIITVFLRCEYQFTAAFQKDLFLEDMAAQRHEFCSPLLVNVVLAYACVCSPRFANRAEYWNPHTLHYRFLAEARRIWELELETNDARITTIQAGIVFNVIYNLCGLDEIGQPYRLHAIALAHKLHLFDHSLDVKSPRMRRGMAFTAWALFNWETLVGFSFLFPPLLKKLPGWVLPDPIEEAQFYGEVWVRYPSSPSLSPSYFGQVFKARSQFRIIMNEFSQQAFSDDSDVTLEDAHKLYGKLKRWFDSLSASLQPKTIVLPGQLQLHMYYYHLILTIYEPLLESNTKLEPSPQDIVNDARKYLQTLVRLYYLRHGFEAMDLFIVIPLILLGYECIDAIGNDSSNTNIEPLRSTLVLVARGLYDQRRNHYLAEALFRVIRGRMRHEELHLLKTTMRINDEEESERQTMTQAVRSKWPVSVVKKKQDINSHILSNLLESSVPSDMGEV